ncbi:hypothetical protein [Streptomyces canus]|uniref:hypothetical protein n=1 Tax=Streptomyces canus TaxID=58343 RepID=UPI0030DF9F0F
MSEFVQQLPALIGVVVGALGSYVAVVRGDRARFHREEVARWEERRLAVYSDYARTLKKAITPACRVAAHFGNDPHPHPLPPEEAAPLLAESTPARDPDGEALLGYYAAVRDDLALPPGLAVRWQLPPVRPS